MEQSEVVNGQENLLSLEEFWDSSVVASLLELFGVPSHPRHNHLFLPLLLLHRFLHFTFVIGCTDSSKDISLQFILCSLSAAEIHWSLVSP